MLKVPENIRIYTSLLDYLNSEKVPTYVLARVHKLLVL